MFENIEELTRKIESGEIKYYARLWGGEVVRMVYDRENDCGYVVDDDLHLLNDEDGNTRTVVDGDYTSLIFVKAESDQ